MSVYQFDIIDLVPYLILFITAVFFGLNKIKNVNSAKAISLLLVLFSSIRYGVGYDYYAYLDLIGQKIADYNFERIEWLSKILMSIARSINFPQFYFIICAIFTIYPIYFISCRYSKYPSFSLLLYLLIPLFYLESFSIVRNAMAYSIVFFSIHFLYTKRYVLFCLIIIIAGGIHSSAYIGLLLPLVYKFSHSLKINISIFIISFCLSFSVLNILSNYSNLSYANAIIYYAEIHGREQGPYMKLIIYSLNILNLIFWKRLVIDNKNNHIYLSIVNIGTCLWIIFSFEGTISLRLSSYFLLFNILLIPSYLLIIKRRYSLIVKYAILIFFTLFFISSFYINIKGYVDKKSIRMSYLPYHTIFNPQRYENIN
jgi:hypothetical protein